MTVVLFDTPKSQLQLYPLSLVYPVSHIRHGCFTGIEWYERISGIKVKTLSDAYKKPVEITEDDAPFLCIDASVVPSIAFWQECLRLNPHEMLEDHSGILAYMIEKPPIFGTFPLFLQSVPTNVQVKRINHPMDWVKSNAEKILLDISLLANDTPLLTNDHINRIFGEHPVFMESGAKAMGCTFNTIEGPVFIGKDALLMEGGLIRGPVSIGRNAVVKMGAQLYSGTTIGKNATAGGEIKNSILSDFSNKAHHGYLGDSIIGMWCNLGAGTSNSNVKNNAGVIKMWSEEAKDLIPVGQKAGIIMGDFSKTAINTSINSGTTIGCCTSIHMLPQGEKNIPGFIWGGYEKYAFEKLKRDIKQWMDWKNVIPDPSLWNTLWHLYNTHTGPYDENHDSYN